MKFCIVTPCLNAARFIDETIFSVLSQAGPFRVRYHVQDGGSTDGTLEKLDRWRRLVEAGLPSCCDEIEFTFASEKDDGLYDAVNRGFAACGEGDVLSWINADDRYQPAAFVAVAEVLHRFHNVRWVTGAAPAPSLNPVSTKATWDAGSTRERRSRPGSTTNGYFRSPSFSRKEPSGGRSCGERPAA